MGEPQDSKTKNTHEKGTEGLWSQVGEAESIVQEEKFGFVSHSSEWKESKSRITQRHDVEALRGKDRTGAETADSLQVGGNH